MTGGDVAPEVQGFLSGITVWDVVLVVAGVVVVAGLWIRGRKAWRKVSVPAATAWEDWTGTEDRPGVPGRPGVMAQLQQVRELAQQLGQQLAKLTELLADHPTRHEFDEHGRRIAEVEHRLDRLDRIDGSPPAPNPTVTTVTVNQPPESETT